VICHSQMHLASTDVTSEHITICIGFARQGFGSGRATGVASVSSYQKLPLCPTPAGSKRDPLLAKDKPLSDGGSTSGVT